MRLVTRVVPRPELTESVGHDTIDLHVGFGSELDVYSMDRSELRLLLIQAQAALEVFEARDPDEPKLLVDDTPVEPAPDPGRRQFRHAREQWETFYFTNLRMLCDGNKSKMARVAGLERTYVHRKLIKLGMEKAEAPEYDDLQEDPDGSAG